MAIQARVDFFSLNIQDVLPSYFAPLFKIHLTSQLVSQIYFPLIVIVALILFLFILYIFIKYRMVLGEEYGLLEITPPYESLQSALSTTKLFSVIHSLESQSTFIERFFYIKKTISCELVSSKEEGIRYILRVSKKDSVSIKKSINAYLSKIEIKETQDYLSLTTNNEWRVQEFKLTKPFAFPLQEQVSLDTYDPIAYITTHMTKLAPNEIMALQIICSPILQHNHSSIVIMIHRLRNYIANNKDISDELRHGLFAVITRFINLLGNNKHKSINELSRPKQLLHQAISNKINEPLFEVTIRLWIKSDNMLALNSRVQGVQSSFETLSTIYQSLTKASPFFISQLGPLKKLKKLHYKNRLLSFFGNPILSLAEISSIYHLPYTSTTKTEDIQNIKSPKLPPPLSLKQSMTHLDIKFANNHYSESTTTIGLTLEERRRHVYMIGATGTGKTTLLLQMIYNDILNNKGLALIDPHGDLSERILGIIPKKRIKDVIYFNPYDIDYSIGVNVLEMAPNLTLSDKEREKDLITSSIISIFHKLYAARYSGPRMEHILRNTILTALDVDNPTLFTIYKLLTDSPYRKKIVTNLKDPILKDFWKNEFDKLGSFQKAEQISPITNKLGRFLTTTMTRNVLNQAQSKLDFDNVMNTNKILICDLSKGKIGEDTSSFLGSLLIAKLQLAALDRVHMEEKNRPDFFLYIDEFQNFATATFAQVLSEARKYRFNTILAHQTISQIEDKELLKVILANVGTVISFRTSNPSDEDYILPLFSPQVKKHEIANLPSYNFYIKINAITPQDTFTGETNNFLVKGCRETAQTVIAYSREVYGNKVEHQQTAKLQQNKEIKAEKTEKIGQKENVKRVSLM